MNGVILLMLAIAFVLAAFPHCCRHFKRPCQTVSRIRQRLLILWLRCVGALVSRILAAWFVSLAAGLRTAWRRTRLAVRRDWLPGSAGRYLL